MYVYIIYMESERSKFADAGLGFIVEDNDDDHSWFNASNVDTIKRIGKGGQAIVFLVTYKAGRKAGRKAVFKVYNPGEGVELAVEREYTLATTLKKILVSSGVKGINFETCSDFILEYAYYETNPLILIGQYSGEIDTEYRVNPDRPKTSREIDKLLRADVTTDTVAGKMASIIHCIHQVGFYHLDIKPDNFLITTDKRVYLIDFGVSIMGKEIKTETVVDAGTPQYRSPFMKDFDGASINDKENILQANDIWALVCTLFYYYIGNHWYYFTKYPIHPLAFYEITNQLFKTDPSTYLQKKHMGLSVFFERYFYLEPPESNEMTATKYITAVARLQNLNLSLVIPTGGSIKKRRTKKNRKTKYKKSKRKYKKSKRKSRKSKRKPKKSKRKPKKSKRK